MKIIGTIGGVVIASIAMLQPAEAGHRGGGRSFSSGFNGSGGARSFAAPTRSFSGGGARFHGGGARFHGGGARYSGGARVHNSSTRFSSGATFRNRSLPNSGTRYSGNRPNRFDNAGVNTAGNRPNRFDNAGVNTPGNRPNRFDNAGINNRGDRNRTRTGDGARFNGNRSTGFRNRGFNNNNTSRVVGHRGRNWNRHWDKRRDHYWNGHRCRWINNSWVIFATGFYPYGYGYYPYGGYYPYDSYSYYDEGYSADTDAPDPYAKSSDHDEGATDSSVSEIQSALSRAGYYSGAVDGTLGPETRNALRRYQRDRGLPATGQVDRATMNALGLR